MAWLMKLDTRARGWPAPFVWAYTALKAILIVVGALALGRMLLDRVGIWPYFP